MFLQCKEIIPNTVTLVIVFVLLALFSNSALAAVERTERPEEDLLILELHANDIIRNSGLLGYLSQGDPLSDAVFPLGSLSRALSYPIKTNPAEGEAEGWFISEKNQFRLDIKNNTVNIAGRVSPIPAGGVEAHFEDIYVRLDLLEKWFGFKMQPDISTLRLYITQEEPFAFQEEEERKKRAESLNNRSSARQLKSYSPDTLIPYKWFTNPSIVYQHAAQLNQSDGDTRANTNFSIQSYMDAFKFETRFLLSGAADTDDGADISDAQLYFQKRDPSNSLLGPLKAGRVSFGDVTFPDVPLSVSRKRGRGISISSDSNLSVSRSFGSELYILDGDAPVGWDAELYRNGYFIGFQEIGSDGRYSFEDIELIRGFNLFQIVLYGPEGQKQTVTQRVMRGNELLREGEVNYDFAAGQPETDFLPFADDTNSEDDDAFGGSGRFFYGIQDNLTVGGSVFSGYDSTSIVGDRLTAANISAVTALGGVKAEAQYMIANEGRSAYSFDARTQIVGTNLSAEYTRYSGFVADERDLLTSAGINANRNFGRFSTSLGVLRNTYQEDSDELELNNSISANIAGVRLTNRISKTIADNDASEHFDGDFSAVTSIKDWRLRGILDYDLKPTSAEKLKNVNLTMSKKLDKTKRLRLNGSYDFINDTTHTDVRYTQEFDDYSLDVNAGTSSEEDHFVGVAFRTGFQTDQDGKYQMVGARAGGLGSIGLRAYLDENGNRSFDEGEKPIEYVAFRSNRGIIDGLTDENGTLFVNGLAEGLTRIEIDESSLQSIYIKPYKDMIEFIPRSGVTATIDIGFEQLGEIDGFVFAQDQSGNQKPYPGQEVVLYNADTGEEITYINSEYDGYYIFSALPLGRYEVKISPLWNENANSAAPILVDLNKEKSVVTDLNFVIQTTEDIASASDENVSQIEPALGTDQGIPSAVEDSPKPVVTDGLDIATGEPLRGLFIHIGSEKEFSSAQEEQKRLWEAYENVLSDIPLYIYKIKVGDQTYHRIVGLVDTSKQGNKVCDTLISAKSVGGCSLMQL